MKFGREIQHVLLENYVIVKNQKRNHQSLYLNLDKSYQTAFKYVTDEPYGLRELFKVILQARIGFLIIHNCNKWLELRRNKLSIIELIRIRMRRIILYRVKGLIFVSPFTKEYFEEKSLNKYYCYYVPFGEVGMYPEKSGKYQHVAIPGSMNSTKNYEDLYACLQKHRGNKITVEFLGIASDEYGTFWQKKFRYLSNPSVEVVIYSEYIDANLFDARLKECDAIFVDFPERIETQEGYIEVYGESKETGSPWLAFKYSKPIIVPGYYKLAYPNFEIKRDRIFC